MLGNKKGMILVGVYLIIAVLFILGTAFMSRSISESRFALREKDAIKALYIAEAGIDRALMDLKKDFENEAADSWRDGDINNNPTPDGPDNNNFYSLYSGEVSFGDGGYTVDLKNVSGKNSEIQVRSTGSYENVTKTVEVYARIKNYSPWNNAIFAGTGASGSTINGNVDVRGSVHILGMGLNPADLAIDMGGSAGVGNNYQGIPATLDDRIPDAPTVIFNGESVESLGAEVRIKRGQAGLSGSAAIGNSDNPGDSYKETVDGVYVTDGYAGNKGANNVYSDNGTTNTYDLGDTVSFPSLSAPYQSYASYQDYLRNVADEIISGNLTMTPDSSTDFDYYDEDTSKGIKKEGDLLTIGGIVYIEGELEMEGQGGQKTIIYSGTGSILAEGEVEVNVSLLTSGSQPFLDNVIGIMTPQDIELGETSQIDLMGAFYAEGEIEVNKQTDIAGTLVSNYFNLGNNVPNIYQVPELFDNLPPGMIASESAWIIEVVSWRELEE